MFCLPRQGLFAQRAWPDPPLPAYPGLALSSLLLAASLNRRVPATPARRSLELCPSPLKAPARHVRAIGRIATHEPHQITTCCVMRSQSADLPFWPARITLGARFGMANAPPPVIQHDAVSIINTTCTASMQEPPASSPAVPTAGLSMPSLFISQMFAKVWVVLVA